MLQALSYTPQKRLKRLGLITLSGCTSTPTYRWSYIVVYTNPSDENDEEVAARGGYSRRFLGPYTVGDRRTLEGVYKILRFLDHLFDYKTSVWLPGIAQIDNTFCCR
ncbi:hypothetical protein TWF506_003074 [Arthrobotrys conoides]|uniref:Uncharacterized protein n=1 Tax=Arthrobotrys conoides TaxID=74498 RepID=A0AAN8NHN3_9PEZI